MSGYWRQRAACKGLRSAKPPANNNNNNHEFHYYYYTMGINSALKSTRSSFLNSRFFLSPFVHATETLNFSATSNSTMIHRHLFDAENIHTHTRVSLREIVRDIISLRGKLPFCRQLIPRMQAILIRRSGLDNRSFFHIRDDHDDVIALAFIYDALCNAKINQR